MPAPDREHRHEPRGRRGRRADPALALAGSGSTGTAPVTFQLDAMDRCASSARRLVEQEQGIRGRGRDPVPDARRGRDRLGRRVRGRIEFPNAELEDLVHRSLRRPADLQLRLAGGGHGRRNHARDPRRRPHLEHAEADPDPAGARPRAARLRARSEHPRDRRQEALEAARGASRSTSSATRATSPRRSSNFLALHRVGARRRDDADVARRDRRAVLARGGRAQARARSTTPSSTG